MANLELFLNKDSPFFKKAEEVLNSRQESDSDYFEKHHIVPKFYFKLNNLPVDSSEDNIINLSGKNHFLIHYYYYKASKLEYKSRLAFACICMHRQMLLEANEKKAKEFASFYEEVKKQASEAKKGIPRSEETKKKLSLALKGKTSPNKGKIFSTEWKQKLSKAHKNLEPTEAMRNGWRMSAEKRRGKQKNYQKTQKMLDYYKTKKRPKSFDATGRKPSNSRKVLKKSTGEIFASTRDAAKDMGVEYRTFWAGMVKKSKKYADYAFLEESKRHKILKKSTGEILSVSELAVFFGNTRGAIMAGLSHNTPKYNDYKLIE